MSEKTPVIELVPYKNESQELTKHIREVKTRDEVLRYLDKEIIVQTLKQIDRTEQNGTRDHMFITFLWMTGTRVTEAISLRKKDIDSQHNELKILWQKRKAYTYRTLAVSPALINMLSVYTSTLKAEDKVFPFTRQNADLIVKKHFSPDIGCHVLRHSYARNFLLESKSSAALLVLQRLLGHHSIATTMKYLQIAPKDMHEGIKEVNYF